MELHDLLNGKLFKKSLILTIWVMMMPQLAFTQAKKDSLFLQYLFAKDEHRDAITLISQLQTRYPDTTQQRLELPYWKGLAFYSLKKLDSCTFYFSKVNPSSQYFKKSLFLSGIAYSYLHDLKQAKKLFISAAEKDTTANKISIFEMAGVSLLSRNLNEFDSLKNHFSDEYYPLQKQQSNFSDYRDIIQKQQRKSPFKAAILSAILPGAGKIYVGGQLGQGISTFLQNAILGFQAYEGLRKDGVSSPRFIIYGGLFSLFYIGNIWGTALSVKIKRQEFNDKIDEQILFDMHIPLRTIFN